MPAEPTIAPIVVETETQTAKDILAREPVKPTNQGGFNTMEQALEAAFQTLPEAKKPDAPAPPPPAPKPEPKKEAAAAPEFKDIPEQAVTGKKPEPKPSTDDPEVAEAIKGLSPKAADNFRSLTKRVREAEARAAKAAELEAEIAKIKAAPANGHSEVETLRKQLREHEEALGRANLAEVPRFKAHYEGGIEKEIALAKSVLGDKANGVIGLLSLPQSKERDEKLAAVAEELDSINGGKLAGIVDRIDRLRSERDSELSNWRQGLEKAREIEQESFAQAQARAKEEMDRTFQNAVRVIQDPEKGLEVFRTVEDNEEWNQEVASRLANAKDWASRDLTPHDRVELAVRAEATGKYRQLYLMQRELIGKLRDELKTLKGTEPSVGQEGDTPKPTNTQEGGVDAIVRIAKESGLLR